MIDEIQRVPDLLAIKEAVDNDPGSGRILLTGDRDAEAIRHLDAADRIAPDRTPLDPIARELVETLDCRARRRVWELDSLRNRFGGVWSMGLCSPTARPASWPDTVTPLAGSSGRDG